MCDRPGAARPHPDPGRPGGALGTAQGTRQENTLFIYIPEMPSGELRCGQPTGWVSAYTVIFWHRGLVWLAWAGGCARCRG